MDHTTDRQQIQQNFARNVRTLRMAKRLTQDDLAERMGVHRSTITRIENAQHMVSFDNACLLADILGADVGMLREELG